MKQTVFAVIFLLSLGTTPLFAIRITSVDDVLRMHRAGVSDELILAAIRAPHEPFTVTPDDVIAMEDAGISAEVIEAVVAVAKPDVETASNDRVDPASTEEGDPPAETDGDGCVMFDPPVVIFWPYWFVPEWLEDPWWYMPRLDSRVGKRAEPPPSGQAIPGSGARPRRESPKAGQSQLERMVSRRAQWP